MKKILLISLLVPVILFGQKTSKGYAFIGPTGFLSKKYGNVGGFTTGVGFSPDQHVTLGAGFDMYIFSKQNKFGQAYVDFRAFFSGLDKKASPFLALQPGAILYSNTIGNGSNRITTNGSFAINALVGMMSRPQGKTIGIFMALGYSNISFTTKVANKSSVFRYGGAKISGGISF